MDESETKIESVLNDRFYSGVFKEYDFNSFITTSCTFSYVDSLNKAVTQDLNSVPRLIHISGHGGNGKTFLAAAAAKKLKEFNPNLKLEYFLSKMLDLKLDVISHYQVYETYLSAADVIIIDKINYSFLSFKYLSNLIKLSISRNKIVILISNGIDLPVDFFGNELNALIQSGLNIKLANPNAESKYEIIKFLENKEDSTLSEELKNIVIEMSRSTYDVVRNVKSLFNYSNRFKRNLTEVDVRAILSQYI